MPAARFPCRYQPKELCVFIIALALLLVMATARAGAVAGSRPAGCTPPSVCLVWPLLNRIEGPVLFVIDPVHA